VAKLGLRCSPSVITGEPVASKALMVSATARSKRASSAARSIWPAANFCRPCCSSGGRGMLPMGSVGSGIAFA
jgi:hypothetical protein